MGPLSLKRIIDLFIYLSVAFGIVLLPQLYFLVPSWLMYSVTVGCVVYLVVAVAIATHHDKAYPVVFVLAVLTLLVSLPQPEHSVFVEVGLSLASFTFISGSVLQIGLIVLIPIYLLGKRRIGSSE